MIQPLMTETYITIKDTIFVENSIISKKTSFIDNKPNESELLVNCGNGQRNLYRLQTLYWTLPWCTLEQLQTKWFISLTVLLLMCLIQIVLSLRKPVSLTISHNESELLVTDCYCGNGSTSGLVAVATALQSLLLDSTIVHTGAPHQRYHQLC